MLSMGSGNEHYRLPSLVVITDVICPGSGPRWSVVLLLVVLVSSASVVGYAGSADAFTPVSPAITGGSPPYPSPAGDSPENQTPSVDVNITGPAALDRANGTTYLWPTGQFSVTVIVGPGTWAPADRVCLTVEQNKTASAVECSYVSATATQPAMTFEFDSAPTNVSGLHRLHVAINGENLSDADGDGRAGKLYVVRPAGDLDDDGLSNQDERSRGTSLLNTDSDQDGLLDGPEVKEYDSNPLAGDTDRDGLRDGGEIQLGTHPNESDTDQDGVPDGKEVELELDPKDPDTDNDGLNDGVELRVGTDPTVRDSDGDGLIDGQERSIGTNPRRADTDGDLLSDAFEWRINTDPTNPLIPLAPFFLVTLVLLGWIGIRIRRSGTGVKERLLARVSWGYPGSAGGRVATTGPMPNGENATPRAPPMTDEELVLSILEREGGRARQTKVVQETDWSKAKVSRVLSRMEDGWEITRIQIGRENLVCLDDHVPKGVKSPVDD